MTMQVSTNGKGNHHEQPTPANGAEAAPLVFTGERFVEGSGVEITYDHWVRYHFARQFAAQKRVLDVACGEGYGSALLSSVAAKVDAFDADATAIAHARRKYGANKLNYSCATTDEFFRKAEPASYDFVTCFEFIEHVDDAGQQYLLEGIRKVLAPGGIAIISTPDKKLYTDITQHRNEFHIRELYRDEFQALLERHFPHVKMFDQGTFTGSAVITSGTREADLVQIKWQDIIRLLGKAEPGVEFAGKYVVAIVGQSALSDTEVRSSVLLDPERKLVGEEVYSLQVRVDSLVQKNHELEERAKSSETALRLRNAAAPSQGEAGAQPALSSDELGRFQRTEVELRSEIDQLRSQVATLSKSIVERVTPPGKTGDADVDHALRLRAAVEPLTSMLQTATTEVAELRAKLTVAERREKESAEQAAVHEKIAEQVLALVERKHQEVGKLARIVAEADHLRNLLHHSAHELAAERERSRHLENMLAVKLVRRFKPLFERTPLLRDTAKLAGRIILGR